MNFLIMLKTASFTTLSQVTLIDILHFPVNTFGLTLYNYVYSSMDYMCVMNNLKLILCGIRISIFQKYSHSFRLILSFLIFKFPFISRINIVSLFSCCKVQRLKREMISILNLILFPLVLKQCSLH